MTNSILIENLTIEELKTLIREVTKEELKNALPKETRYLTRAQVAAKLNISLPTLDKATWNGKLKAYRIGGRILYKEEDIILTEISIKKCVKI
jgi:excisionase family DNA binding protein